MDLSAILDAMPYVQPHGLKILSKEGEAAKVLMPFKPALENHLRSVHASAIFTVGETAAGIQALLTIPDGKAIPILRGAQVTYSRRAASDLTGVALIDERAAQASRAAFERSGRADLKVGAEVFTADGAKVFDAIFDYALRPAG